MALKLISDSRCFGGRQKVYEHDSKELECMMKFAIYLPSASNEPDAKLATVYFLSGLTCTEQNMITKSGFQRYADNYDLVVVCPDTSPRGCNVPGENDSWDLGTGAGFYVDATRQPWKDNYRMHSYVTKELRQVVEKHFRQVDPKRVGITGHSMGGHGALVAFLRNPDLYKAVSAFAPISNPMKSEWGIKCFTNYLGNNQDSWKQYDATELVKLIPRKNVTILVEQGDRDEWMDQLVPDNFVQACRAIGQPLQYNLRRGYDHGYYFVSTYIGEHLRHFATELNK